MSKRKVGEVSEDGDGRVEARLASTVTPDDDTRGLGSDLSNDEDDNANDLSNDGDEDASDLSNDGDDNASDLSSDGDDNADQEKELLGGLRSSDKGHSRKRNEDEDMNTRHESLSGEEDHSNDEQKGEKSSTAFGRAFGKIMNKRIKSSELIEISGPVLADRKRLLLKKLDKEEAERKEKSSNKEDIREIRERGHTLPLAYTDGKEKALIRLATKGVVRLFNAVSKAQKVQSSADNASGNVGNAVLKQRKATFLTELRKPDLETQLEGDGATKETKESSRQEFQPRWPALKPDFMLGRSLKHAADWDKSLTNLSFNGDV